MRKDEYFSIGLEDIAPYPLPRDIVEKYCHARRIAVSGLRQQSLFRTIGGAPMFVKVSDSERKFAEKFADELLTAIKVACENFLTVNRTVH